MTHIGLELHKNAVRYISNLQKFFNKINITNKSSDFPIRYSTIRYQFYDQIFGKSKMIRFCQNFILIDKK